MQKVAPSTPQLRPSTPASSSSSSSASSSSSSSSSSSTTSTSSTKSTSALRCPPSPVMRAKEGFFQLLREKKRDFEARLDYEFLWLRELREEVDHLDFTSSANACSVLLPATSTATHKRQRLLVEARESLQVPLAPSSPVFGPSIGAKGFAMGSLKRTSTKSAGTTPSSAGPLSPNQRLPTSRLGTIMSTTRGRRGGSIIKALFTDVAQTKNTAAVSGQDATPTDKEKGKEKWVEEMGASPGTVTKIGMHKRKLAANKENDDVNRSPDRASPSSRGALFVPPANAWQRSPSPVQKVNGKGVIAVRVRKTPLSLRQQNLKKRARELGRTTPLTPEANTPVSERSSPRQELLLTEDDVPMVIRVDPSDEASPGVTAECDVDWLREELNAEKLSQALEEQLVRNCAENSTPKTEVPRTENKRCPETLKTELMLARFNSPHRSASWFSLGTDLSEVEVIAASSATRKLSPEVSRDGTVRETDVERRSCLPILVEVVGTPTRVKVSDEPEERRLPTNAVDEERIESSPLLTTHKRDKEITKPVAETPNSQRKSRIMEREERLRRIDQQREEIKKRREARERRRRESELGSVIVHDIEQQPPDYFASVFRQPEPKPIRATSPESARRRLLAHVKPPSFATTTSTSSSPPLVSTSASPASEQRADKPISRVKETDADAGGSTSPSRLRNVTISPTAAMRRKMRAKSVRLEHIAPHTSTLSPSIQERLKQGDDGPVSNHQRASVQDADHKISPSSADSTIRQGTSPASQPPPASLQHLAKDAEKEAELNTAVSPKRATDSKEDLDELVSKGCETVLAYSSLKEKRLVEAFFEAITKHKREREDREREEKKARGTVAPFPIPSPGSPSSSFITMSSGKRPCPTEESAAITPPTDRLRSSSAPAQPIVKPKGSPPKKRKLDDGESASPTEDTKKTQNQLPTSSANVAQPRPKEMWRGEGEGTLRIRQIKERKENGQRLYGLDAELARKAEEKLRPQKVREAVMWVYKAARGDSKGSVLMPSSDRGAAGLFDCLKSGRLLCEVANKVRPGIIPKIHVRPIPLMEQENLKMYLAACERMGMKKADLFVVSDLYEEKYLPAVLQNIISLSRLASASSSFKGPRVQL